MVTATMAMSRNNWLNDDGDGDGEDGEREREHNGATMKKTEPLTIQGREGEERVNNYDDDDSSK